MIAELLFVCSERLMTDGGFYVANKVTQLTAYTQLHSRPIQHFAGCRHGNVINYNIALYVIKVGGQPPPRTTPPPLGRNPLCAALRQIWD